MDLISQAKQILETDGVVGIPTETVYGLAASIKSERGIDKIFKVKERPFFDPLIVHIASIEQAKECCLEWKDEYQLLASHFWPGPLTLIVPKNKKILEKITSGLDTVGLRMPNHSLTLELLNSLSAPVAAPSANKFTKTSPTTYEHVKKSFPELFVLDGGACEVGIESTIVGFENGRPVIYRPGMITKQDLEECLKCKVLIKESPVAPGHMKHHYMPETPIIAIQENLDIESQNISENLLKSPMEWILDKDPTIAARTLYQNFRKFDKHENSSIILRFTISQLDDERYRGLFNRVTKAASYFIKDEK